MRLEGVISISLLICFNDCLSVNLRILNDLKGHINCDELKDIENAYYWVTNDVLSACLVNGLGFSGKKSVSTHFSVSNLSRYLFDKLG